jgi:phosphopantothenoylcysteine decarboxylase/phosphopantothenate--cysteine ligase
MKNKNIILGVTASIAAYKAGDIIRRLKEKNFSVTVIMTKDAEEFITPLTLQTLSGNKVYRSLFELVSDEYSVEHVALAQKADLILVAPATANIIGKVANGICDDLLSCVIMATGAPVLFAPAMNEGMYKNKILQDNIEKLNKFGYKFIGPGKGKLADGKTGLGRLAEIDSIIKEIQKILK